MSAGLSEVEDAFVACLQAVAGVTALVLSDRIQALPVPLEEFNIKQFTGKGAGILVAHIAANYGEKWPGQSGGQDSRTVVEISSYSYARRQVPKHAGAVEIADAIYAALFPDVQLTIDAMSVTVVPLNAQTNLSFRGLARTLQTFQLEFTNED